MKAAYTLCRQATVVLPCLQASFEDLLALTSGSRPPILRLHSDKAREFLSPVIHTYLSQQGVRQTVNSGYDPQGNSLAERWLGIIKVRATALLADVRLPPEYWSYACRCVAYVHTHRVTEVAINKTLPHFGDVVVVHLLALKTVELLVSVLVMTAALQEVLLSFLLLMVI